MAKFSVLTKEEIPSAPKTAGHISSRMREYERYVDGIKPHQGGKLTPEEGESARGIALRVARAAKRRGHNIETHVIDGIVYFTHIT